MTTKLRETPVVEMCTDCGTTAGYYYTGKRVPLTRQPPCSLLCHFCEVRRHLPLFPTDFAAAARAGGGPEQPEAWFEGDRAKVAAVRAACDKVIRCHPTITAQRPCPELLAIHELREVAVDLVERPSSRGGSGVGGGTGGVGGGGEFIKRFGSGLEACAELNDPAKNNCSPQVLLWHLRGFTDRLPSGERLRFAPAADTTGMSSKASEAGEASEGVLTWRRELASGVMAPLRALAATAAVAAGGAGCDPIVFLYSMGHNHSPAHMTCTVPSPPLGSGPLKGLGLFTSCLKSVRQQLRKYCRGLLDVARGEGAADLRFLNLHLVGVAPSRGSGRTGTGGGGGGGGGSGPGGGSGGSAAAKACAKACAKAPKNILQVSKVVGAMSWARAHRELGGDVAAMTVGWDGGGGSSNPEVATVQGSMMIEPLPAPKVKKNQMGTQPMPWGGDLSPFFETKQVTLLVLPSPSLSSPNKISFQGAVRLVLTAGCAPNLVVAPSHPASPLRHSQRAPSTPPNMSTSETYHKKCVL